MHVTPSHGTQRYPRHGPRLSQPHVNIGSITSARFIAYSPAVVELMRSLQRWPTSSNFPSLHLHGEHSPLKTGLDMATSPLKPQAELLCIPGQPLTHSANPSLWPTAWAYHLTKVSSCHLLSISIYLCLNIAKARHPTRMEKISGFVGRGPCVRSAFTQESGYTLGVARCLVQLELGH